MKKTWKALALVLTLAIGIASFGGCKKSESKSTTTTAEETKAGTQYPLNVTDGYGTAVTIKEEPKKIVTCSPAMTELVFSLGKGECLVGRTSLCNYPAEAEKVPVVLEDLYTPNLETIVAAQPDLVLVDSMISKDAYDELAKLGCTVVSFNDETKVDGVYDKIQKLGEILNASDKAEKVISDMKAKIDSVNDAIKDNKMKPTVYYVVGFGEGGDYTATGDTFVNDILSKAGVDNVAKSATGWVYNVEDLVMQDPNIIIIPAWADGSFQTTAPYSELTAVKEGHVIVLDSTDTLDRQCARNADAVEMIAKLIFPECFEAEKAA